MKKILLILGIVAILAGASGFAYWYWQSQNSVTEAEVEPLQTVALDNPDIDSFDDVCTKEDNGQLSCSGNIKEFGCTLYTAIAERFIGLQPVYPVVGCNKENRSSTEGGVYQLAGGLHYPPTDVDYVIIKDGQYQLITSVDQLSLVFAPIQSVDEAKAYFGVLGKGLLVLDQEMLSKITSPQVFHKPITSEQARFNVAVDTLGLSQVTKVLSGYTITAYSSVPAVCVDEVYFYTYLLKQNGELIQQNKQLIWEVLDKPSCIYD